MRCWIFFCLLLITACGETEEKTTPSTTAVSNLPAPSAQNELDTMVSFAKDTASHESHAPTIKKPAGIYQFILPYDATTKILHTISFYPSSFRLQEEYFGRKDSIVITEGTWAPSQGFIWLYKDQLARGRYIWKGDTLQYYSPRLKTTFSLSKLTPASTNKVWQDKMQQGAVLLAVGNEPFWSVEVSKRDSIILSMPDWTEPLRVKISTTNRDGNATVYTAATDSLSVTVHPYFCSDGMSDFIYTNKVTVKRRGKTYQGCGMVAPLPTFSR